MNFHRFVMLWLAGCALWPSLAAGHHSHAGIDRNDVRVFSGVVTKYGWTMPHVYLKVQAADQQGKLVEYSIEMGNPPSMARAGWNKDTFKLGDRITWQGAHATDKNRPYTTLSWAEKDGVRIGTDEASEASAAVAPSTDFSGVWTRDDPGGFKPHYLPPKGWPYTPAAQARVDAFDEKQNPAFDCIDPGPPKSTIMPYPHRISRSDDKTIVIERDLLAEPRIVYLDRNHPPGPPSKMGHSIGWFEGKQLVIETGNFVADRWGTHTGVDSSEQKHLLERYSLSDDGLYLQAEITVTDPLNLREPVTFMHHWKKIADRELVQAPCTAESTKLWVEGGYQN